MAALYIIREIFLAWYSGADEKTNQPINITKITTVGLFLMVLMIPSFLIAFVFPLTSRILIVMFSIVGIVTIYLILRMGDSQNENRL